MALSVTLGATSAFAGTFQPEISEFNFRLGALPPLSLRGNDGSTATLSLNGATLTVSGGPPGTIWTTVNFQTGTALFTGVPGINDLFFTLQNGLGTATSGFTRHNPIGTGVMGPSFGGAFIAQQGVARIQIIAGFLTLPIAAIAAGQDLNVNSGMGGWTVAENFPIIGNITNTGAPYITGQVNITAVNQNVIHVGTGVRASTTGIAFTLLPTTKEPTVPLTSMITSTTTGTAMNTVTVTFTNPTATVTGSKSTTNGIGVVTLVAPTRVITELAVGNTPVGVFYTFRFIPEPGSLLLIGSGVVGLVIIGRKRMKR
jgi:hypothetical protein